MKSKPQTSPASDQRRAKVDAARHQWIRKLVDLSRRNNLLYFRDLQVGTLDLSEAPVEAMQRLLQSHRPGAAPVKMTDLVPAEALKKTAGSLQEIARKAQINFEERGLDTLFLALGLATWRSPDDGRPSSAPVLLMPIEATQTGKAGTNWSLLRGGDVLVNDVLVHALEEEHQVTLDSDSLLALLLGDDEDEVFDPAPCFEATCQQAASVPDFKVEPRWVLGNFAFQKMAIVNDLKALGDALAAHDIVAAIAGDAEAVASAAGDRVAVDPVAFDEQPPDNEFLIRDADSSQHQAIESTLRGQNGVISGPPGTGKSQTIANVIAELVARGKTVLFVAEKRAALDVVLSRLDAAGLGHLCLDCHGAESTRRRVAEQLQLSLELLRAAPAPDVAGVHKKFSERRTKLNAHARLMNSPIAPWGLSPYQIYGQLLHLPEAAKSTARITTEALKDMTPGVVDRALDDIEELIPLADLVTGTSRSAWLGANLTTGEEARRAVERVRGLTTGRWLAFETALRALIAEAEVNGPASIGDVPRLLNFLANAQTVFDLVHPEAFHADLGELERSLQPASSIWASLWASLTNAEYRKASKNAKGLCKSPKVAASKALAAMSTARETREGWRGRSANPEVVPKALNTLAAARSTWNEVAEDVTAMLALFSGKATADRTPFEIGEFLGDLASDGVTPARIVRVHELKTSLQREGFDSVVNVLAEGSHSTDQWPSVLRWAWLQ